MEVTGIYARLSYAKRLQVGCVIVKDGSIIAIGYNGTPPGWSNECEVPDGSTSVEWVIHAEQNALDKIVRSNVSSVGASVFITHSPCLECAKRLLGAQVKEVFYRDFYRTDAGVQLLLKAGIMCEQFTDE